MIHASYIFIQTKRCRHDSGFSFAHGYFGKLEPLLFHCHVKYSELAPYCQRIIFLVVDWVPSKEDLFVPNVVN